MNTHQAVCRDLREASPARSPSRCRADPARTRTSPARRWVFPEAAASLSGARTNIKIDMVAMSDDVRLCSLAARASTSTTRAFELNGFCVRAAFAVHEEAEWASWENVGKDADSAATVSAVVACRRRRHRPKTCWSRTRRTPKATLKVLMQPISPFVMGQAQTTTSIIQLGDTNHANASVNGASNLSSISQTGSNNRAVQSIEGSNSALLLVQGGTNNNVLQASQGERQFPARRRLRQRQQRSLPAKRQRPRRRPRRDQCKQFDGAGDPDAAIGPLPDADGSARPAKHGRGHRSGPHVCHSQEVTASHCLDEVKKEI